MYYSVVWDNGFGACDSIHCQYEDIEEAKWAAFEILESWMESMEEEIPEGFDSTDDAWNYMIDNAYVYVGVMDPYDPEDYEELWSPSDDELKEIGWVER